MTFPETLNASSSSSSSSISHSPSIGISIMTAFFNCFFRTLGDKDAFVSAPPLVFVLDCSPPKPSSTFSSLFSSPPLLLALPIKSSIKLSTMSRLETNLLNSSLNIGLLSFNCLVPHW